MRGDVSPSQNEVWGVLGLTDKGELSKVSCLNKEEERDNKYSLLQE
jgi:hypothetical protein